MPETINKFCVFINNDICDDVNKLTWNNLKPNKLNEYSILFKQIQTRNMKSDEDKKLEKLKIEKIQMEKKNRKVNK
jgi:hypothetical protein